MAKVKLKKTAAKSDNTSVKKPVVKEVGPSYNYMGKDTGGISYSGKMSKTPTKKDSADYLRGYSAGLMEVSRKSESPIGVKYEKGGVHFRGLNARVNEGFSEGRDKAIENKEKTSKKK
jgi:hypothetical protein